MEPEKYYPAKYFDDLGYFNTTSKTKSLDLCPLTLGRQLLGEQLKNEDYTKYASIVDFFTCQYCLNLISQGIHLYVPEFYWEWRDKAGDYLNIQGCYAHSFGGGVSRPIDLVIFLRKYEINIDELHLDGYVDHFLNDVLIDMIPDFPITDFVNKLMHDSDCKEIHSSLHEMRKASDIYYANHPTQN